MKNWLVWLIILAVATINAAGTDVLPEKFRVATYNLWRFSGQSKGTNKAGENPSPKPREERDAIAAVLQKVNPDILVVQELGDEEWLENLRQDLLAVGVEFPKENCQIIGGNDRFNRLAVLAKYKWQCETWNVRGDLLVRGFLGAKFKLKNGQPFCVYNLHLKSQISNDKSDPNSRKRRSREVLVARALIEFGVPKNINERRDFFIEMFKKFQEKGVPAASGERFEISKHYKPSRYWKRGKSTPKFFVILGDLNDVPEAEEFAHFREDNFAISVPVKPAVEHVPADLRNEENRYRNPALDRFSYVIRYAYAANADLRERNIRDYCGQFDQIYVSPSLMNPRRACVPATISNFDGSWIGSDHRCVFLDFDFAGMRNFKGAQISQIKTQITQIASVIKNKE